MRIEIINGITVRIYKEDKKELPLFLCNHCGYESYFIGTDKCVDCTSKQCRACGKVFLDIKYRVIQESKKIINKPTHRFICNDCHFRWISKQKKYLDIAHRDAWIKCRAEIA